MKLQTGRDIRGERNKRGIGVTWLASQIPGLTAGDLGTIERCNLPLSELIADNARRVFEQFDAKQVAA